MAPKPPIFLKSLLLFAFLEILEMCFTNLSAFLMLTPLFLYVKFPKSRWKEIERAEKDDAEGRKIPLQSEPFQF